MGNYEAFLILVLHKGISFYIINSRPRWSSIIVLAIEPKARGLKPGRGQWIFKGDKNPQHAFFRRGKRSLAPCRKILRHVKNPCIMKEMTVAKITEISRPVSCA
jgi:hypothetical protein